MEDKYQGPQKIDLRDDGSASPGKSCSAKTVNPEPIL